MSLPKRISLIKKYISHQEAHPLLQKTHILSSKKPQPLLNKKNTSSPEKTTSSPKKNSTSSPQKNHILSSIKTNRCSFFPLPTVFCYGMVCYLWYAMVVRYGMVWYGRLRSCRYTLWYYKVPTVGFTTTAACVVFFRRGGWVGGGGGLWLWIFMCGVGGLGGGGLLALFDCLSTYCMIGGFLNVRWCAVWHVVSCLSDTIVIHSISYADKRRHAGHNQHDVRASKTPPGQRPIISSPLHRLSIRGSTNPAIGIIHLPIYLSTHPPIHLSTTLHPHYPSMHASNR